MMMRGAVTRLKQSHFMGSVGLGLYISKQIVKAHKGRIEVVSDNDNGTTFTVALPRSDRSDMLESSFAAPIRGSANGQGRAYG